MRIRDLYVYPIKSCRGSRVERAHLDDRGLVGDRRFMVTDPEGRFVTLRTAPRLTLVRPRIVPGGLRLHGPDGEGPLLPSGLEEGERFEVEVWGDRVEAIVHPDGSAYFSDLLGGPHRLVHMPRTTVRRVDPSRALPTDHVSFADGFPLLLTSQASLDTLNDRLEPPVSMSRFRPNVVVDGVPPFAEDHVRKLSAGAIDLVNVKPCERCVATTVDPETAEKGFEPLRTLATFRRIEGKVLFGINLLHRGQGELRVGMTLCPSGETM